MLCEANMVLKHVQDDGSNRGTFGKLICTNFKISFLGEESALDDVRNNSYLLWVGCPSSSHLSNEVSTIVSDKKSYRVESGLQLTAAPLLLCEIKLEDANSNILVLYVTMASSR